MQRVSRLRPAERAEIDGRRVSTLIRDMGQPSAERLFGRALDEIEDRLKAAEAAGRKGDLRTAAKAVRQIVPIAGAVGLTGIGRVAGMCAGAADAGDGMGFAATLARIGRLNLAAVRAIGEAWAARL